MTETTSTWPHPPFAGWEFDMHALRHLMREARHRGHRGVPSFGPRGMGAGRGFPFGSFDFGGGRRAGRGDIRTAILALLNEEPMHGYQIMQELESRSGGAWRVSPGSVYPTLQQLQDEGLITSTEQPGGRRVFALTDAGREQAQASAASPPWQHDADGTKDDMASTRKLLAHVAAATWQVGQTGSPGQVAQAQEILRETRRRLYQVLADETTPSS
jgi:DNA-binding PadR family transcriptional regulator